MKNSLLELLNKTKETGSSNQQAFEKRFSEIKQKETEPLREKIKSLEQEIEVYKTIIFVSKKGDFEHVGSWDDAIKAHAKYCDVSEEFAEKEFMRLFIDSKIYTLEEAKNLRKYRVFWAENSFRKKTIELEKQLEVANVKIGSKDIKLDYYKRGVALTTKGDFNFNGSWPDAVNAYAKYCDISKDSAETVFETLFGPKNLNQKTQLIKNFNIFWDNTIFRQSSIDFKVKYKTALKRLNQFKIKTIFQDWTSFLLRGCARFLYILKKPDESLRFINAGLKLNPHNPILYKQRADVFRGKKDYEKAIEDYKTAVELKANYNAAQRGIIETTVEKLKPANKEN